ncbi:MAG TPA: methyltransferase domain-containing protein, partial [Acidobacteriaceae bacterium]
QRRRGRRFSVFKNPFQKSRGETQSSSPTVLTGPRIARHSSGWANLKKQLLTESGLYVLDIGPTSPTNINLLTNAGHSVYMADLVPEAQKPEWMKKPTDDGDPVFDVEGFFEHNLGFTGREFDAVLLWTTLDYLPDSIVQPTVDRLHSCMKPGGKVLALFHNKQTGDNTAYCRYHLSETDAIDMQESSRFPIKRAFTNRNIEKIFERYANCKFFLAKDNLYEVIITR